MWEWVCVCVCVCVCRGLLGSHIVVVDHPDERFMYKGLQFLLIHGESFLCVNAPAKLLGRRRGRSWWLLLLMFQFLFLRLPCFGKILSSSHLNILLWHCEQPLYLHIQTGSFACKSHKATKHLEEAHVIWEGEYLSWSLRWRKWIILFLLDLLAFPFDILFLEFW